MKACHSRRQVNLVTCKVPFLPSFSVPENRWIEKCTMSCRVSRELLVVQMPETGGLKGRSF